MITRFVVLLMTLTAVACGSRSGSGGVEGSSASPARADPARLEVSRVPVPPTTAPLSAAAAPDAGQQTGDAGVPGVDESAARAQLSLRAETVEADTIRVRTLRAITLEAGELRITDLKRVDNYPVAKDEGMVKLEGHLIQADRLEAHHVRARLVIADEAVVHRVIKLRGEASWQSDAAMPEVVNRCVHLTERNDDAVARCTRGAW